jgi:outer membrane lipoprotein SlyB
MNSSSTRIGCIAAAVLAAAPAAAWAQTSIQYGRITNVQMVTQENARAQTGGAIVGGALGASVGSGRSGSNRALGGIGGAFAGQQLTRMATNSQAFEYTILIGGTSTIRFGSDEAGFRVGDCVAVERGGFNNLRLVADSKCATPPRQAQPQAAPRPAQPTASERRQADACIQAKEQLLAAESEEAFDRAERRVRLLCD